MQKKYKNSLILIFARERISKFKKGKDVVQILLRIWNYMCKGSLFEAIETARS